MSDPKLTFEGLHMMSVDNNINTKGEGDQEGTYQRFLTSGSAPFDPLELAKQTEDIITRGEPEGPEKAIKKESVPGVGYSVVRGEKTALEKSYQLIE